MNIKAVLTTKDFLAPDFEPRPHIAFLTGEWTKTFRLSWERFRHEVQQIANRQRETVEGVEWSSALEPGDLVIPTDDDDWLHPGIVDILTSKIIPHDTMDCWFWQTWKFSEMGLQQIKEKHFCQASHAWIHRPERESWKFNHMKAEDGYRAEDALGWVNSNEVLHLWNNTPGSMSALLCRVVWPHKLRMVVNKAINAHQKVLREKPAAISWAMRALGEQLELLERL